MCAIQITAENREDAMREALERLQLPEEALEIEWAQEDADLLAGARPYVQMNVTIRRDYVGSKIRDCVKGLLEKMEMPCEVTTTEEEGIILVTIRGPRPGVLIGMQGETLDALQHLVVRMTGLSGREIPLVLLDVGDYRKRRILRLRRVAQDLARAAIENHSEEHFDPMNAVDRKIVHTLLKNIEGVRSYSRGEEPHRCVVVGPVE